MAFLDLDVWKKKPTEFNHSLTHYVNSSPPGQNGHHFADDILDAYSWMKCFVFWSRFDWSLFLRAQLTITHIGLDDGLAANRQQAISWTNADPIHWCIYAPLGGDELTWHNIQASCLVHGQSVMFTGSRRSPEVVLVTNKPHSGYLDSKGPWIDVDYISIWCERVRSICNWLWSDI